MSPLVRPNSGGNIKAGCRRLGVPDATARPWSTWIKSHSPPVGRYVQVQLETAKTLGLDHVGLPISSDTIASLFGVAKHHGVGQTQDAARIALRFPALCGAPTREEVEQVLAVSVTRQHEFTTQCPSLTQQRREVLGHPERLEGLGRTPGSPPVELLPSPKKQPNDPEIITISTRCENPYGPQLACLHNALLIDNAVPPGSRETTLAL